jgi:hypothetical protein
MNEYQLELVTQLIKDYPHLLHNTWNPDLNVYAISKQFDSHGTRNLIETADQGSRALSRE